MKKSKITFSKTLLMLFAGFLFIMTSCQDKNTDPIDTLIGTWDLRTVSCECEFIDLEPGEQTWTINEEKTLLTVVNNVTEELHTILDSGVYPIEVDDAIFLLQDIPYEYSFVEGGLVLDHMSESDGPYITFTKK